MAYNWLRPAAHLISFYPLSSNLYPLSYILYPLSSILYPLSSIFHPLSSTAQNGEDPFACGPGCVIGIIHIRVKLNGDPALVANFLVRLESRGKVDRAVAGNQVVMNARGGNIFEMKMTDIWSQPLDRRRWLVADAVRMADVEVQAHGRRIDMLHELQKLVCRLN